MQPGAAGTAAPSSLWASLDHPLCAVFLRRKGQRINCGHPLREWLRRLHRPWCVGSGASGASKSLQRRWHALCVFGTCGRPRVLTCRPRDALTGVHASWDMAHHTPAYVLGNTRLHMPPPSTLLCRWPVHGLVPGAWGATDERWLLALPALQTFAHCSPFRSACAVSLLTTCTRSILQGLCCMTTG